MLSNLKKLTYLGLGGGNKLYFLEGKNTSNGTFPSQIQILDLSSCNLVHFPNFIQHLQGLTGLFISNNGIKAITSWMWNKTTLQTLDVSNKILMGEISPSICNLQSLVFLGLSSNNLVGKIPPCLGSFSQSLQILMLDENKLTGNIPQTYVKGNALQFIDFGCNKLHGPLPRALVNCRMLELLDVSHNHFNDSFPFWLGSLPKLKVASFRDNRFHGAIMCPLKYTFPQLQIIDLSQNGFSKKLTSEIITCFKSMIISNKRQLDSKDVIYSEKTFLDIDSLPFSMSNKGVVMEYLGISGEIPDIMGSLNRLVVLNLSNNLFTGSIPSSFGKLSNLEVLDLTVNSLSGNIPQQLTALTFLDFFNVSSNNLSGPIPANGQLSTFDNNSFEGNKDLCGIQLLKKCEDPSKHPLQKPDGDQDSESGSFFELYWMVILIGYGGGLVAGLALGNAFAVDVFRLLKKIFSCV
ncbi:receptor like protein 22-like [Arachis stenosperma]|uniref:receptor like protein 22-like n=1 Tax=Arachis stenosperma TaxID=217475 RepID=UPI0025AD4CD3|nr:receptor like protein 22-like [Arachis stenosperma]